MVQRTEPGSGVGAKRAGYRQGAAGKGHQTSGFGEAYGDRGFGCADAGQAFGRIGAQGRRRLVYANADGYAARSGGANRLARRGIFAATAIAAL